MKVSALAGFLLLSLALVLPAEDKKIWAKSVLGQPGPEVTVEKWLTPKPDTEGKFILVDLWATWCGPCRKAIPELNDLQEKFRDKLVVIGITSESEDTVKAMTTPEMKYAVGLDPQDRMAKALEVKGIPHVIIMDPKGIVRWEGFPLLDDHELTAEVVQGIITEYGK